MPLIKLNNRSIKDVTSLPFGVGNLIHIQSQTASNSASISFTTGINSTYKEYQFYFINIKPASDGEHFTFNFSTNSGSNYNVTKTTTFFHAFNSDGGLGNETVTYRTSADLAQSTDYQQMSGYSLWNNSKAHLSGSMQLFNPSSTTYVKHFISRVASLSSSGTYFSDSYLAGYGNTTSAINAINFQMSAGNIADGTIAMFGVL